MPFILMSVGGLLTGRSSGNLRRRLSGIPPVSPFIVFQGKAAVAASVILAGFLTPILLCLRILVLNQCSCSTHQGLPFEANTVPISSFAQAFFRSLLAPRESGAAWQARKKLPQGPG
jgi:hypothetical protein